MAKGKAEATLFIERVTDPGNHLLTALSCLRLEYVLQLAKDLGIEAEPEYDIGRHDYTISIEASPEEISRLVQAAYEAGLGNFDVQLEDAGPDEEAIFDQVKQLEVTRVYTG
ncbi:MAG TPA: hypothetical protein GXX30_11380 [Firmicutes bacterium]|nr:hypothetical protein [Candidatus Fermentithermobacillaceae bacterium]